MTTTPLRAALALALASAGAAHAQEAIVSLGATQFQAPHDTTYNWRLEYLHELAPWLSGSLAYVNEGHVPAHHRDGVAAQLWLHTPIVGPGLSFAVGAGPYQSFDTVLAASADGFHNAHSTGGLYSAAMRWTPANKAWFLQLRYDDHQAQDHADTRMVSLGLGVRLDQDGSFAINNRVSPDRADRDEEVAAYVGRTVVNSFAGENASAQAVEWRHSFGPVLAASAMWLNEGDARLIRRDGALVQGWLEPTFRGSRWSLGAGAGAYVAVDKYRGPERTVMPSVAMTVAYRFHAGPAMRLNWYRIVSSENRDSDVFLLGLGYRF